MREHYILGSKADMEPEVKLERVREAAENVWRVQIADASFDALPGRSALRERPEKIVSEIDPKMGFTGYRPEWAHSFHAPRVATDEGRRSMRRFNGRTTEPLYVFGSDNRVAYPGFQLALGPGSAKSSTARLRWHGHLDRQAHYRNRRPYAALEQHRTRFMVDEICSRFYNGTSLFGAGVQSYVSDCQGEEYSFPFSTERVNVVAGGSGFTNMMAWGRTNWPL